VASKSIPYFTFYPEKFMGGVRGMSAQEVGVYTMLLCRMYEEDGAVEYNTLRLSTYCGMRVKTFTDVAEKLMALGKITMEDGRIFNARAAIEISDRADKLKNNSKAGKISAEKRQGNQGIASTTVQQPFNHKDKDIDKEEEKSLEIGKPISCDPDFVAMAFDEYNAMASQAGWPSVQARTPARRAALKARLSDAGGIDGWRSALEKARASPHLCGQNDRGWTASFDFLTSQASFAKLMEGNYDARNNQTGGQDRRGPRRPHDSMVAAFAGVAADLSRRQGSD
jgi:uncharacterized protein YdaU (DUF1376 family)